MSAKRILLVDESSVRQPYLGEVLQDTGSVTVYKEPDKALSAVKRGLGVDVAVIHYRMSLTPLIQAIRRSTPQAKIVAFGSPRSETPLGVDKYLTQPVLGSELRNIVDAMAAKRRNN
ncbi:MAG TPA: response regulator [Terriglobales bacterium]|nr:response regulator [Terriglobales bacterium]